MNYDNLSGAFVNGETVSFMKIFSLLINGIDRSNSALTKAQDCFIFESSQRNFRFSLNRTSLITDCLYFQVDWINSPATVTLKVARKLKPEKIPRSFRRALKQKRDARRSTEKWNANVKRCVRIFEIRSVLYLSFLSSDKTQKLI